MSVVGFDFGSQHSRIAVIRSGGVDVICNEVSDRATPSMVSFDPKRRYAGDASKTLQVSNFRNTITNLPRLVGRLASEPSIVEVESQYETCRLVETQGVVGSDVAYRGEQVVFSNTELVAMFLNKLKGITFNETKAPVSDVVISVPAYFTEKERRALVDAAEIAGLNCLRTVNDTTAAAINYGMMKTDIPVDKPKNVIILDIGYSSLKSCVASFTKGEAKIRATVWDMNLGGRDFDELLVNYFSDHFVKTRRVNIRENKKALLRLRIGCEKMKKILSGVQLTRLELEALIDGADFPLEASRQLLEELSQPLLNRIEEKLRELVSVSQLSFEEIDSVEIIGGTTRIPAIKALIPKIFGKEVSTTLNADEAVSRGCALFCAIDSPLVRVRDYKIADVINFPVNFTWKSASDGQVLGTSEGFSRGHKIDSHQKVQVKLTSLPVHVEAHYSESSLLPPGTPPQLAKFTIYEVADKETPIQEGMLVSASFNINNSGLVEIDSAFIEAIQEQRDNTKGEEPSGSTSDSTTNSPQTSSSSIPSFKPKKIYVKSETFSLPRQTVQSMKEAENKMALHDKLVAEIDDCRNAVEECIYESRNKLEEVYAQVANEEEKEKVRSALLSAEDWLYGEGADCDKEQYVKKLGELKGLMSPLVSRLLAQNNSTKSQEEAFKESPTTTSSASSEPPAMDMD